MGETSHGNHKLDHNAKRALLLFEKRNGSWLKVDKPSRAWLENKC